MIKRSLYIMAVLLSTAQMDAMQYNNYNNQSIDSDCICSIIRELPLENEKKQLIFRNIKCMDSSTLISFKNVLDILPQEAKTADILFNISRIHTFKLSKQMPYLYKVLKKLPKDKITPDILLNISRSRIRHVGTCVFCDQKIWDILYDVLEKLPLNKVTQEILLNISKMDKVKLYCLYDVLDKLPPTEKTEQILLNISKMNNLYALRELQSALETLQQQEAVEKDILLKISEINKEITSKVLENIPANIVQEEREAISINIGKMNSYTIEKLNKVLLSEIQQGKIDDTQKETEKEIKEIFLNIGKMDGKTLLNINNMDDPNDDRLLYLFRALSKLPSDKVTTEILFNISEMNFRMILNGLEDVLDALQSLPQEIVTPEILLNISKKCKGISENSKNDKYILYELSGVISLLPKGQQTTDQLQKISEINDYDELSKIHDSLRRW